ncbi:hypothetical protein E2C01_060719 [Portunus trituberculatus]|uniref:Uncharacterized protein n=1 Tax=Portunus trituberculatus TaxID=210409 RepID=A0A5B7H3C3_PORTR|nr:hypothetical protein [Portunus trituberculatus]
MAWQFHHLQKNELSSSSHTSAFTHSTHISLQVTVRHDNRQHHQEHSHQSPVTNHQPTIHLSL